MKRFLTIAVAVGLSLCGIAAYLVAVGGFSSAQRLGSDDPNGLVPRFGERSSSEGKPHASGPAVRSEVDRLANAADLRRRWVELAQRDADVADRDQLARETVQLLLCSEELLQLSEFLNQSGISVGNMVTLERGVRVLLRDRSSPELRELLLETIDRVGETKVVEDWCLYAGEGCPEVDFDEFLERLSAVSGSAADMAVIGRSNKLVKVEPETAIASTLEVSRRVPEARIYLQRQIEALPESVDFEAIEEIISTCGDLDEVVDLSQRQLVSEWARRDVSGVVSFMNANSQRLSPSLMTEVGRYGVSADQEKDYEWVASFPEGPHRDAVIEGAVWKWAMSRPDGCWQFLKLVSNPESRSRLERSLEIKAGGEGEGG